MFNGISKAAAYRIGNLGLRSRILGLFIAIITLSVLIVAGSTYTIGKNSVENMVEGQLSNSVRFVIDQISLLTGAYTSNQFSDKLNYVLSSEKAGSDTNTISTDTQEYIKDIGRIRNALNEILKDSQEIFVNVGQHKHLSSWIAHYAYSLLNMANSIDELKSRFIT